MIIAFPLEVAPFKPWARTLHSFAYPALRRHILRKYSGELELVSLDFPSLSGVVGQQGPPPETLSRLATWGGGGGWVWTPSGGWVSSGYSRKWGLPPGFCREAIFLHPKLIPKQLSANTPLQGASVAGSWPPYRRDEFYKQITAFSFSKYFQKYETIYATVLLQSNLVFLSGFLQTIDRQTDR